MSAKILQFPEAQKRSTNEDSEDVIRLMFRITELAEDQNVTGIALTATCNGRILIQDVAGELRRDRQLAEAAVTRLMSRIEWKPR